jgi:hypothetical protein
MQEKGSDEIGPLDMDDSALAILVARVLAVLEFRPAQLIGVSLLAFDKTCLHSTCCSMLLLSCSAKSWYVMFCIADFVMCPTSFQISTEDGAGRFVTLTYSNPVETTLENFINAEHPAGMPPFSKDVLQVGCLLLYCIVPLVGPPSTVYGMSAAAQVEEQRRSPARLARPNMDLAGHPHAL